MPWRCSDSSFKMARILVKQWSCRMGFSYWRGYSEEIDMIHLYNTTQLGQLSNLDWNNTGVFKICLYQHCKCRSYDVLRLSESDVKWKKNIHRIKKEVVEKKWYPSEQAQNEHKKSRINWRGDISQEFMCPIYNISF